MKGKSHSLITVLIPPFLGLICGLALFLSKVPSLSFVRLEFLLNTIISCSATISGFILAMAVYGGANFRTFSNFIFHYSGRNY